MATHFVLICLHFIVQNNIEIVTKFVLMTEMEQMTFAAGALTRTTLGSLQRFPRAHCRMGREPSILGPHYPQSSQYMDAA